MVKSQFVAFMAFMFLVWLFVTMAAIGINRWLDICEERKAAKQQEKRLPFDFQPGEEYDLGKNFVIQPNIVLDLPPGYIVYDGTGVGEKGEEK